MSAQSEHTKAHTTSTTPTLVVVGATNAGKSSFVANLTRDPNVRISPIPGTTTQARRYEIKLHGGGALVLIDTPGFEDAPGAAPEIERLAATLGDHAAAIARLVENPLHDDRFKRERELLAPILDGGAIIYIVDASKPWSASKHKAELQILSWTRQPSIALLNTTRPEKDYSSEWIRQLDPYFNIVMKYNIRDATYPEQLDLLDAFAAVHAPWKASIRAVVAGLADDWKRRRHEAAVAIATMIGSAISHTEAVRIGADGDVAAHGAKIAEQFRDSLRQIERKGRANVLRIYEHPADVASAEPEFDRPLWGDDLFEARVWSFGLSRLQIVGAGAVTGAAGGLLADVAVGGLSGGFGAVAGAVIGAGVGAAAGGIDSPVSFAEGAAKGLWRRMTGAPAAGDERTLTVGPHKNPNFAWILLARAVAHWYSVEQRTHAQAGMTMSTREVPASAFRSELRQPLAAGFAAITKKGISTEKTNKLASAVFALFDDAGVQQQLKPLDEVGG